jgi:predicted nucleotidyltransferase
VGLMSLGQALVEEVVRRLLNVSKPDRIILFGSAATGQMTRDSDIDLLVIAPSPANTLEERARLRQSLRGLGFAFDVFIMAADRF